MTGKNIGDLLNAAQRQLGQLHGRLQPDAQERQRHHRLRAQSPCSSPSAGTTCDYIPHHAWFQYYTSTANPTHARPSSSQAIGHTHVVGGNDARSGQP